VSYSYGMTNEKSYTEQCAEATAVVSMYPSLMVSPKGKEAWVPGFRIQERLTAGWYFKN
jgi:hypothetical protein